MHLARAVAAAAVAAGLLGALAACAPQIPLWSADYARAATTHRYADVPPDRALAAAKAVLAAATPARDLTIRPTSRGFHAERYVVVYVGLRPVSGQFNFDVSVSAEGKGSLVTLSISDHSTVDDSFGMGNLTPGVAGERVQIADPYRLFFARMDKILGKRPDWVSCGAAPKALGARTALQPLCLGAKDDVSPLL